MKRLLLALSVLFAQTMYAEPGQGEVGTVAIEGDKTYEIVTAVAKTDEEVAETKKWIENDLKASRAKNPDIEITVKDASGDEQKPKVNVTRAYKVGFAVTRAIVNGSITAWSLTLDKDLSVPWERAIPQGLLVVPMAYSLQYFNDRLQDWFVSNGPTAEAYERRFPNRNVNYGSRLDEAWRWYIVDFSYLGVLKIGMLSLSIAPKMTVAQHFVELMTLPLISMAGQGAWDIGFAKKRQIQTAENPEKAGRYKFFSDLKVLVLSAVTVFIQNRALQDASWAEPTLFGLGAIGVGYYLKIMWQERRLKKILGAEAKLASASCPGSFAP